MQTNTRIPCTVSTLIAAQNFGKKLQHLACSTARGVPGRLSIPPTVTSLPLFGPCSADPCRLWPLQHAGPAALYRPCSTVPAPAALQHCLPGRLVPSLLLLQGQWPPPGDWGSYGLPAVSAHCRHQGTTPGDRRRGGLPAQGEQQVTGGDSRLRLHFTGLRVWLIWATPTCSTEGFNLME